MKLVRNLSAGLVSSVWGALLGLAVVPLYLRYLGLEAYGLIGFFATTQALFQLLDLGMAPTINREIARCAASDRWDELRTLLHTLSIIYWSVAGLICLTMLAAAPLISSHWLRSGTLTEVSLTRAVWLMGLVVACRWPTGLYQAALNGMQRLTVASGINIAMSSLASVGAICVLAFVSSSIEAFFLWQAAVGLAGASVSRQAAWRAVGRGHNMRFEMGALRSIWRFSVGIAALTFSGLIFSQLDKVLLSRLLSLDDFGKYTLAAVVAAALGILITPFYNVVYPRFSAYVVAADAPRILQLYKVSGRLLATLLFGATLVIVVAGEDLIRIWTGNATLAHQVAPLAALIAVGTALHGTMYIPHALQLAYGKTFIPLAINLTLLVIMVPVTIALSVHYGAWGGAMAWLVLHGLYVLLGTALMQIYVGDGTGLPWLLQDIGTPLLICSLAGLIATFALRSSEWSNGTRLAFTMVVAAGSVALTLVASPGLRSGVRAAMRVEGA